MHLFLFSIVLSFLGTIYCLPSGYAKITQGTAEGYVTLKYDIGNKCTRIQGSIKNLTPNKKHGFHIHQFGDFSGGCLSTGGHYNPDNVNHGGPKDQMHHVGDLGNIDANEFGVAAVDVCLAFVKLAGERSVIGRSFVVHAGEDDLGRTGNAGSLTTGNAGSRIGCGVIGIGSTI